MWTAEDRDRLKAAVLALATGQQVVTVNYSGPPARSVTYNAPDLTKVRELLAQVEAAVASAANRRSNVRYAVLRKGF